MNPPRKPTRSGCFRPDDHTHLDIFADREEALEDIVETLKSYLAPGGAGAARVLVRGARGVGKSILTRKAISVVVAELGPLYVCVDGAHAGYGADAFLRRFAQELAREVVENATDEELKKGAEMLRRVAGATKVTEREVSQWSRSLKFGTSVKHNFINAVHFEFGLERGATRTATTEHVYERVVDEQLLHPLIREFVADCQRAGATLLLFLDNLDQVGYGEFDEDVRKVTNLTRLVLDIDRCVVVANLRSEFVSADLARHTTNEIHVPGMSAAEVVKVVNRRIELATATVREELEAAGFPVMLGILAGWTDNAWAMLNWLSFLDYRRLTFTPDDRDALRASLEEFALQRFPVMSVDELRSVAKAFRAQPHATLRQEDLVRVGIWEDLLNRAVRCRALIPDWLVVRDRYSLSPLLRFLAGA